MTDACHMLSDSLSIFLSIIAIRISRLPANRRLSFGFHRAEVLGALLSILILCSLTFLLVYLAYRRLTADKLEINVDMMIVTAIAGVAFNLIIFGVIHLSNPSHHSHHSHSSMSNINVRAAFIHALGDFIQCIGVLIAAFIIKFTGWTTADPLCTFLFSIIVLMTTSKIICDIINVLMEGVPSHVDYDSLQDDLKNINNVYTIHDLHIWSLSLNRLALSVHIVIDDSTKAIETTRKADQIVRLKYGIHLATIQVELFDNIMSSCNFCKSL
ncbi:unnamed protein product [Dracunculus medinensis]|uniref:Zinc transporter 2 n=1 Tax=Dracunculus medinensis TaxID=318479 RepID=A0A0N4UMH2_DRAME|nr:unnamed protein product [Dracunculus medinensis]